MRWEFSIPQKESDGSTSKKSHDHKFFIPVVFHNLKNYDAHHILRYFDARMVEKFSGKDQQCSRQNVEIIALNLERFVSFEILYLRFIDSCQFLSASLDELVKNLLTSCDSSFDKFRHTREVMGSNDLLFHKGLFPYEHFTSSINLAKRNYR